jgi:hypothetical protein
MARNEAPASTRKPPAKQLLPTPVDTALRFYSTDLIKALVKLGFFLHRRGLLVFLQVRLEAPDLGADRLLVLPMLLIDRSYAIVEDCKNKGIESYIGGKDLCLSHFGYTS